MIKLFVYVLLVFSPAHQPTVFVRMTSGQCEATRSAVLRGHPPGTVAQCLRVGAMADQPGPNDQIIPNKD